MDTITVLRRELKEMWLHVTFKCNLECAHCLFGCGANYDKYPEMTIEDAKKYVEAAVERGAETFYITGGEPLVWSALPEFLEWLCDKSSVKSATLLTNGTLINEKWTKLFARHKKLAIRISLECYTEETNDSFRGTGSFSRTLSGIRQLNAGDIDPWICYTSKSGGALAEEDRASLEVDFKRVLSEEHGVTIKGLKVLGLYGKGRMETASCPDCGMAVDNERLSQLQCSYGAAAGPAGIVPCPILVDVPGAGLPIESAFGPTELSLSHECCRDCFRTGSTCGQ